MTNAKKPALVPVEDVNHFVRLVTLWHGKKVQVLEHMLSVPAGTTIQSGEGTEIAMEGEFLDGFKAGLALALMELGQLPFVAETGPEVTKY